MSDTKDLQMIEKIRGFRVSKKRKKVALIEGAIARLQTEISQINNKIKTGQEHFRDEKKAILEHLMRQRSNVDALFTLQKKELLEQKRVGEALKERGGKEEDMSNKEHAHRLELKALWESEKALLKIEELVKMEVR